MTKCPHCGKNLRVHPYTQIYMDSYGKSATITTLCCGKLVRGYPVTSFVYRVLDDYEINKIMKEHGELVDDWYVEAK